MTNSFPPAYKCSPTYLLYGALDLIRTAIKAQVHPSSPKVEENKRNDARALRKLSNLMWAVLLIGVGVLAAGPGINAVTNSLSKGIMSTSTFDQIVSVVLVLVAAGAAIWFSTVVLFRWLRAVAKVLWAVLCFAWRLKINVRAMCYRGYEVKNGLRRWGTPEL